MDYISPEQARNSCAADIRSDIVLVGLHALPHAGRPAALPRRDMTARLLNHVETVPEDVRHFSPAVPPGLVTVLNRMLAKRPEERYQTPAELLKDLEHLPAAVFFNPRDLMQALADGTTEKPKPVRRPIPETKKSAVAEGSTMQAGAGGIDHADSRRSPYRRSPNCAIAASSLPPARKDRRRARLSLPWLVISGWKAWAAIGAVACVVGLIVMAISLGLGGRWLPRETGGGAPSNK